MKRIMVFLCFLFLMPVNLQASCFMDCMFQKGTICVNNECVPISSVTPTPTPIAAVILTLESKPLAEIQPVKISCNPELLKNLVIQLKCKTPIPLAYFFSTIVLTTASEGVELFYSARKDILNRYVFVPNADITEIKHQFYGSDFAFNIWTNPAYSELFQRMTCDELKKIGARFTFGVAFSPDRDRFEGAAFTFE